MPGIAEHLIRCCREISASLGVRERKRSHTPSPFLQHYGLASLGDLPGSTEMRAAGLLSLDLPADFALPDPNALAADEDPLDDGDAPEFHTDFLGEETA